VPKKSALVVHADCLDSTTELLQKYVCIVSKCWLVAWFVAGNLLVKDFGPYGIIFMNNRCHGVAIKEFYAVWYNIYECACCYTVAMVIKLRDFGTYGLVFMIMCFYYCRFRNRY
jgi:hypothetical protein